MWCPFSWIYSHSSSIRLWDLGLLSVLMFFVQNLVYGIENWPWAWPSQPSSDVTVESSPLAGSSSRDLGAQHREPHGCGSRNHCCISGTEESQWHLQTQKLPLLIGRMHRQCFQVIQVAECFSFGNFAEPPHPVSGIFFFSWMFRVEKENSRSSLQWLHVDYLSFLLCWGAKVDMSSMAKNNFTKWTLPPIFQKDAKVCRWHTKKEMNFERDLNESDN